MWDQILPTLGYKHEMREKVLYYQIKSLVTQLIDISFDIFNKEIYDSNLPTCFSYQIIKKKKKIKILIEMISNILCKGWRNELYIIKKW